jgi:hypothetical protein
MVLKKIIGIVAVAVLFTLAVSCKKPVAVQPELSARRFVTTSETVARIHWLGKKKIAADTNAAGLMAIWNLPESARLEAQTLEKLSTAPWRILRGETNQLSALSYSPSAMLRPLLDDLMSEESYLEIRAATNQHNEMVIAMRLNEQRADLWETNLAAALKSLTGIQVENATSDTRLPRQSAATAGNSKPVRHWSLKKHHAPNLIEFVRMGEWTILGAAQDHNALLDETLARIGRDHAPFTVAATNSWIEADIDLPRVVSVFGRVRDFSTNLPQIFLTMTGDGRNVRARAQMNFSDPPPLALDPWNIPTNFIDADLSSFTAMRGCKTLLASTIWNEFETNRPPNQLYVWATLGFPMQTYFAAPLQDASNAVAKFSEAVLPKAEPWFATHDMARFQRAKTFNGLEWKGAPFISPFLKSAETTNGSFILGGLFLLTPSDTAPSARFLQEIQAQTNLVYYDWETTGPRAEQWTFIMQFIRAVLGRTQLSPQSAGLAWLKVASEKLGPGTTEILRNEPRQFSLVRSSCIPFTAIELQFLVEWLESPGFPSIEVFTPFF